MHSRKFSNTLVEMDLALLLEHNLQLLVTQAERAPNEKKEKKKKVERAPLENMDLS